MRCLGHQISLILLSMCFGLAPGRALAEATLPEKARPGILWRSCDALLTKVSPAKPSFKAVGQKTQLNVLFAPQNVEPLNVRWVNGLNKKSYGLIDEMSDFGFKGLVRFLQMSEIPTRLLVEHMARLGILRSSGGDELYAQMWLLAENKDVHLADLPEDPALQNFLLGFHDRYVTGEIDEVIRKVPVGAERTARLLELFAKALERLDRTDKESVLNLDQAFMEINRLRVEGRLTADTFDQTLMSLSGWAKFSVVDLQAPGWLSATIATLIPGTGIALTYWNHLMSDKVLRNAEKMEVAHAPTWKKQVPNTLQIKFKKSDILDIGGKVDGFVRKYLNSNRSLFSPEFAEDFFAIYPETLRFTGRDSSIWETGTAVPSSGADSVFGKVSEDQRRILYETALFLSLVRGDAQPFSRLTKSEFLSLRQDLLRELGFLDDGTVSTGEIDFFITFAVVEFLGRTQGAVMDSLAAEFRVSEKLNDYDYERRAALLLRRFAFLSYSFARQKPFDQSVILALQDSAFVFNMEHILRLTSSKRSFRVLRELDRRRMNFLFYRNLFFFAASSEAQAGSYSTELSSQELGRWRDFQRIMTRATDDDVDSDALYDQYVAWIGSGLGVRLNPRGENSEMDLLKVKLASVAIMNSSEMKILDRQLAALSDEERALLVKYLIRLPTMIVNGTGFYYSFKESGSKHGYVFSQAVHFWLKAMLKMFADVDRNGFWTKLNPHTLRGDIRFFAEPMAEAVEKYGPDKAISYSRMSIHPKQKTITFGIKGL